MNEITGRRFGRLVALEPTTKRAHGHIVWRCLCDCGKECEVKSSDLVSSVTKSCGCLRKIKSKENAKDISGQRFGRLVAIEPTDKRSFRNIVWRCICDCGNEHEATAMALKSGNTSSCGCIRKEKTADLSGKRFGRLVVIELADKRIGRGVTWRCLCDCGNEYVVVTSSLKNGKTKSCGCLRRDQNIRIKGRKT